MLTACSPGGSHGLGFRLGLGSSATSNWILALLLTVLLLVSARDTMTSLRPAFAPSSLFVRPWRILSFIIASPLLLGPWRGPWEGLSGPALLP